MAAQAIVWVTLPAGFSSGGAARLSVYVSPRLIADDGNATLDAFDFRDWPARVGGDRGLQFDVVTGTGVRVPATITGTLDSPRWRALFAPSTLVRSHAAEPLAGVYGSYPAARLHRRIKAGYQTVVLGSPVAPPTHATIAQAFPELHAASSLSVQPVLEGAPGLAGESEPERRLRIARTLLGGGVSALDRGGDRLVDSALDEAARRRGGRVFGDFVPLIPDRDDALIDFARLALFHRQPGGSARRRERRAGDTQLDFHQHLANLAAYPALMRRLGLVLDLEFDATRVAPAEAAAPGRIKVVARSLEPLEVVTDSISPATAYVLAPGVSFAAAPRDVGPAADLAGAYLNLALERYDLIQVDLDGAALRIVDLMAQAARADGSDAPTPPASFALPPLRSGGLAIVCRDQAERLHRALARNYDARIDPAAARDATYFAEDLLRGWCVDVQEVGDTGEVPDAGERQAPVWHSLHRRHGRYETPGVAAFEASDEGAIGPHLAQPAADRSGSAQPTTHDPAAPAYLAESIARWDGWSLAVPRPAKVLPQPIDAPAPDAGGALLSQLPLETRLRSVPRSLPRLRFGARYRMRARLADLAGNADSPGNADAGPTLPHGAGAMRFLRFEPVTAPLVVPRAPPLAGDGAGRIVLRSRPGELPDAFVAADPAARFAGERHIAPPAVAQLLAEWSGEFDFAFGNGGDVARAFELLARENATFAEVEPGEQLPVPYLPDPLAAGAALCNLPGMPAGTLGRAGAGGIALEALPALDDAASVQSLMLVDFGPRTWPERSSFRLRLVEGTAAPSWDASGRVLTVALPKGQQRTVGLSCHLTAAALPLLGIAQWIEEALDERLRDGRIDPGARAARSASLRHAMLLGQAWLITPRRELTLVHATPQPVTAPAIVSFGPATRLAGRTDAYVLGRVQVDAPSTGRIELLARWSELVDDPKQPRAMPVAHTTAVLPGPLTLDERQPPPDGEDEIAAARFDPATGTVSYQGPVLAALDEAIRNAADDVDRATSDLMRVLARLPRPVDESLKRQVQEADGRADIDDCLRSKPLHQQWANLVAIAGSIVRDANELITAQVSDGVDFAPIVDAPPAIKQAARPLATAAMGLAARAGAALAEVERYRGRQRFGDTRARRLDYTAVATARHADCFAESGASASTSAGTGSGTSASLESAPFPLTMPSSARPPAPRIRYVVPTARWQREPDAPRRREGGGLRLYLERPWFVSGDREMVGVVLGPASGSPDFDRSLPFTSRWGRDPIRLSEAVPLELGPEHFREFTSVVPDAHSADSLPPCTVIVYPVEYDDTGRLFCDLRIDPGTAYFPFVRLAVVRYQPDSIDGLEISRASLADFAQLAPERTVTLVRQGTDAVDITVAGATHRSPIDPDNPGAGRGNRFVATLQTRLPGTADDAGWIASETALAIIPLAEAADGAALWQVRLALPPGVAPGAARVLIEERESYEAVDFTTDSRMRTERTVFAEAIPL